MDDAQLQEIARQLSCPSGEGGAAVGESMNDVNAFITARTIEALAPKAGERIAEIGPGNGALSRPVVAALGRDGHYVGIELSADMARAAETCLKGEGQARVTMHLGDCLTAPIGKGSLDGLMAVNVLYFVEDLSGLFQGVSGWLGPGGRAVFGVRTPRSLDAMPFTRFGFRIRPREEIEESLRAAGFSRIESSYFDEGVGKLGDMEIPLDSLVVTGRMD